MSIQQDQGENNSDVFSSGQYEVNRSLENKNFMQELSVSIINDNNSQSNENSSLLTQQINLKSIKLSDYIKELEEQIKTLQEENKKIKFQASFLRALKNYFHSKELEEKNKQIKKLYEENQKINEELNLSRKNSLNMSNVSSLMNFNLPKVSSSPDLILKNHLSEDAIISVPIMKTESKSKSNTNNPKIYTKLEIIKKNINKKKNKEIDIEQIKIEENMEKMKQKLLCRQAIINFRKNHTIPSNISIKQIKSAIIHNDFDYNKAVMTLKHLF